MNVVVTGGGTIAPIDDVRYIANVSSGRFSAMISEACLRRGASVWHIHTPSAQLPFFRQAGYRLDADPDAEQARLEDLRRIWSRVKGKLHLVPLKHGTVAEYADALEGCLRSETIDAAFLAMAVSDFEPIPMSGKLDSDAESIVIHGRRTPKVIRAVRDWSPDVYLVGFKLLSGSEPSELIRTAEAANLTNRADLTVANDLKSLQAGRHTIHLVRSGHPPLSLPPGDDLADRLVDHVYDWADSSDVLS
ncbi:phosphopantothenoylcysteine decarboxylase domain-containing protein [Singulisphaera rosea]